MATLARPSEAGQPDDNHRSGVARAMLVAGGSFAGTIGVILGAAGAGGLGNGVILGALGALCLITAVTLFTAAWIMRQ